MNRADATSASARANGAVRINSRTATPWARGADWTVGVAAGILLLISLGGWFYYRAQLADIAADHLRLQVIGPARLYPGMPNEYAVTTTSVTGRPVSAQVEFAVFGPDDRRLMGHKEKTDEDGSLTVAVPADLDVPNGAKLEVLAGYQEQQERVVAPLSVEPARAITRLTLDKPLYRPGETIRYRSLTLSRFSLTAENEVPVQFEILDPSGVPVNGSRSETVIREGVGCGEFSVPVEPAEGTYVLVARSPVGVFAEERQPFVIRNPRAPRLNQELEFTRRSYGLGDTVIADFSAQRAEGGPVASARLKIVAAVDGNVVYEREAQASPQGTFRVKFSLPEQMGRGEGQLTVTADDGRVRETIGKTIPIRLAEVEMRFFPEGGNLVADLENRVYFTARDPLGKPLDVRGTVVNGQGQPVVGIATSQKGRGTFSIIPRLGEAYRVELESPADTRPAATLPAVSADRNVVVSAGLGVFQEGRPLAFNVRASEAGLPLVASASCRGVPVGRRVFVVHKQEAANPVAIPVDDHVGGVIRLTIFDYSVSPPDPVAERLLYRQPAHRLEVNLAKERESYSPGERVNLALSVTDENDDPVPATVGVRVVDDGLWIARLMPPRFLLTADVEAAEELEDAGLYLADSREAAVALDLLLGTWDRRQRPGDTLRGLSEPGDDERQPLPTEFGSRAEPPAMFDNLLELQKRYRESLAAYRANRTRAANTLTALSFFGGFGLMMLVAMLNMLNIARGARLWAPAIGVATVCLIVGGILMDPERLKSLPDEAVAFVPFSMDPAQPESNDQAPGSPPKVSTESAVHENREAADETLLWNPLLRIDGEGNLTNADGQPTQLQLKLSDSIATHRVLVDAHAADGWIGSGQIEIASEIPFRLEPRFPLQVTAGDRIRLPVAVVNQTDRTRSVEVSLKRGNLVQLEGNPERELELKPGESKWEHFSLDVVGRKGECPLTFRGSTDELVEEITRRLEVVPPGFPNRVAYSGRVNGEEELVLALPENWEPGSLEVTLELFPSTLADLRKGLDSILGQPHDGLEQVLAASCANVLCLRYMEAHDVASPPVTRQALELLDQEYAKLVEYESPGRGYEWFGRDPADEALTAFGLMQLLEMARVCDVDQEMIDRTAKWLLERRDGEGGFLGNSLTPEGFAASEQTVDAYITWALSESGQEGIENEINHVIQSATKSDDPYLLALAAAVAINGGKEVEGSKLLDTLARIQAENGCLVGTEGSMTPSRGRSLMVETTALAALAWMKLPGYIDQANRAIDWILQSRQGCGGFGSTRATVLALKALVEHAKADPRTAGDGNLIVKKNDTVVAQQEFKAGRQETIAVDGLESELQSGENRLVLTLTGKSRMPYLVNVCYRSQQPANDDSCPLRLSTRLEKTKVTSNEAVRLSAELSNVTDEPLPMTVARLGLPAGLEVRPGQLEQLEKAGTVDHFATRPREIVCYWRNLAPNRKVELKVDLTAAIPGKYTGPPSRAYPYDSPEQKHWDTPLTVEITPE